MAPNTQNGFGFTCSLSGTKPGTSVASFTFFNVDNPTDFITFTATARIIPTDVNDNNSNNSVISINPNPASDLLNINFSDATPTGISEIKIFDLTGNMIISHQINSGASMQSFNISSLSDGIYQVAFLSNGIIKEIQKFVVVK